MRAFAFRTAEEQARDGRSCEGGPVEVRGSEPALNPPGLIDGAARTSLTPDEIEACLLDLVRQGPKMGRELAAPFPGQYMPVALVRENLVARGAIHRDPRGRYVLGPGPEPGVDAAVQQAAARLVEVTQALAHAIAEARPLLVKAFKTLERPDARRLFTLAMSKLEPGGESPRARARRKSRAAIREAERLRRKGGAPAPHADVRNPPWHASRTFARRQM